MGLLPSVLAVALLFSHWAVAGSLLVTEVRLWAGPESTRVVLDLSESVDYSIFTLQNPERIVVDLDSAKISPIANQSMPTGGLVSGIRTGPRDGDGLRVVIDLTETARPSSFKLKPNELYGHRLVLDLKSSVIASAPIKSPPPVYTPPAAPGAPIQVPAPRTNRNLVVAIDAGHGGEDPGAIGSRGTREKDVVLAVSRQLEKLIRDEPGLDPVMIRSGDYYVSLHRRMQLARQANADLFVSVHANSFSSKSAHGTAVYVLSKRGASSESARWLAEQENASDLVGGVSLDDKEDVLASVLLDLSQAATMEASMDLGGQILGSLGSVNRLHKGNVQQANFVVLRSPDIPSILIETAFISNPKEEKQLRSPAFQRKLSRAILVGVKGFFAANPPPGSAFAQLNRQRRQHVIQNGDTLSRIASQYGVTVKQIQAANSVSAKRLLVGKILKIPPQLTAAR